MGAPHSIRGGAPREARCESYETDPQADARKDGQGCSGIGGDDAADSKWDTLLRFGGGNRTEGRRGHRPRDHTAREDLPARMGREWRSAAIEPESRPAGYASRAPAGRTRVHRDVDQ